MDNANQSYDKLLGAVRTLGLWTSVDAVLGWDESTYLPEGGVALRGEQKALIASTVHAGITNPQFGQWLIAVEESKLIDEPMVAANVRECRRAYDRFTKLPADLVHRLAVAGTSSREAWIEARKRSDFSHFRPHLEKILELKREECRHLGFEINPYDAMMANYEPGAETSKVAAVLGALKKELVPLIERVKNTKRPPASVELLKSAMSEAAQFAFGKEAVEAMGFDLKYGRIDTTTHPFCSGFGPKDVRITTRYDLNYFPSSFFSLLHEAGHGLYEQGLEDKYFGLPMGKACSMAVHESQSRLWENLVGRGKPFWEYFFPKAQVYLPALRKVDCAEFVRLMNHVELSPIRVEADEMTYNLHIILRFELEQKLLLGELKVADLPAAWNEKFKSMFGFTPKNDAEGCLQDVHWCTGDFGYFPTYALGNMYAAQFFEAAHREIPDLDGQLSKGQFKPLREWLREKIHKKGQLLMAEDLCQEVTGKPFSHEALVRHLTKKC